MLAATTEARPMGSRRPPRDEDAVFGTAQYTKARAVREHYQAHLAKLEYEEKVASLGLIVFAMACRRTKRSTTPDAASAT